MNIASSLVCLVLLVTAIEVQAQSITIGTVPGTAFCTGDIVEIPYIATGTYTNKNSFIVQISDEKGSFESKFYNAGSFRSTTSGSIKAVIPNGIHPSPKYRVRVISSEPYVVSSNDNGFDIGLGPTPDPNFGLDEDHILFTMLGDTMAFKSSSANNSVLWDFGPTAIPQFSSEKNPKVVFTAEGPQVIQLTAFSIGGCSRTFSNTGLNNFYVGSCFPSIPSNAIIDSVDRHDSRESIVWVVPGGYFDGYDSRQVYVEAGATVTRPSRKSIFYMKAGSVLIETSYSGYIVYENGVSIPIESENLYRCDDLEFNYSDAPPYKIQQAAAPRRKPGRFLNVYPNPATDRITIDHKEMKVKEIVLRSSLGAEVMATKPGGQSTTLDLTQVAAGLYFLDILTPNGIETQKIVVQK